MLGKLRRTRALDDDRYAAVFARSRLQGQGLGRSRIRAALRSRGIPPESAEAGLRAALADTPESEAAERVARRLLRPKRDEAPERTLRRVSLALVRRGFPWSLVRKTLAHVQPAWRDMLTRIEWEPPEPSGGPEETP